MLPSGSGGAHPDCSEAQPRGSSRCTQVGRCGGAETRHLRRQRRLPLRRRRGGDCPTRKTTQCAAVSGTVATACVRQVRCGCAPLAQSQSRLAPAASPTAQSTLGGTRGSARSPVAAAGGRPREDSAHTSHQAPTGTGARANDQYGALACPQMNRLAAVSAHQVCAALARAGRHHAPRRRLPPQRSDLSLRAVQLRPYEGDSLRLIGRGPRCYSRDASDSGASLLGAEVGEDLRGYIAAAAQRRLRCGARTDEAGKAQGGRRRRSACTPWWCPQGQPRSLAAHFSLRPAPAGRC